ncbi:MAG: two pore domain potassium channel family protein [Gammaproteobacteria bacterium]|nr:two pore domain potassium channel family protein [Gammaproteobacteria bacterium]
MLLATAIGFILVALTVLIHYETLRITTTLILPRLTMPARQRLLVVMLAVFIAHLIEIWLYAGGYYLLAQDFGLGLLGEFGGNIGRHFSDYLYFSTVTYTSLGLGDVYPLGDLRLIAGFESLTGLLMIAWSASFTYLMMEKFWNVKRSA